MPIRVYHELVLIAEDVETTVEGTVRSFSVRVFDSPVGQGTKKEQVTVPADLGRQVRWLAGRNLDQDLQKQIELGESLAAVPTTNSPWPLKWKTSERSVSAIASCWIVMPGMAATSPSEYSGR